MSFLPQVTTFANQINHHDYPHKLALVVVLGEDSWKYAVVVAATGEVLAWDVAGVSHNDRVGEIQKPLEDYEWDGWDDMPSKQLFKANGYWLGQLAYYLMPSYSINRFVASTLVTWFDDRDRLTDSLTVAYFPVSLEGVTAEVQLNRHASDLLVSKLKSL